MLMVKQGLIISLQFTAFDIDAGPSSAYGCIYDHLTIMDGDGTTLMGKSCGPDIQSPNLVIGDSFLSCPDLPCAALPPNITSNSNIVKLLFSTDGGDTRPGWSVSWSAVTPGECQQHLWMFLVNFSIIDDALKNTRCFQLKQTRLCFSFPF